MPLAGLAAGLLTAACDKAASPILLDFVANGRTLTADRSAGAADTFEVRAFAEVRDQEQPLARLTVMTQETYYRDAQVPRFEDTTRVYFDTIFSQTSPPRSYLFVNRFSASTNAGIQTWTYTATDASGKSAIRRYRITVRPADSALVVHTYAVRLQAPRTRGNRAVLSALRGLALPSFATASPDYQRLADILYVPAATGPSLASPTASSLNSVATYRINKWRGRRATALAATAITRTGFDNITTDQALSSAVTAANVQPGVTVPVARDRVVAFRTADGNDGLLLVSEVGAVAPVDLVLTVKVRRR
ncbi:hypothetical protein GCM10027048_09220 [Hymenobacter coalescens]